MKLIEFNNYVQLCAWTTDHIIQSTKNAIREKGFFTISLCGGSSPVNIFKNLANKENSKEIDWDKVFIFWGDERFVKYSDKNSNYNLINSLLLSHIPIPKENIFGTPVNEATVEKSAQTYEKHIVDFFTNKNRLSSNGVPIFDITLQGAGNDGHTASLFPGIPQLKEKNKLIVNVKAPAYAPIKNRISFTFKLINNANSIILLLSGKNKGKIATDFLNDSPDSNLPIQLIDRSDKTTVLIDKSIYHF